MFNPPQITITPPNTTLPNTALSAITWPSLPFALPKDPGLVIPPPNIGPVEGEPDSGDAVTVLQPTWDTIDTTNEPVARTVNIPQPPDLSIDDITLTVPPLDVRLPQNANIDWAYEAYANAIMDTVALQAGNLDSLFDNLWTTWIAQQEQIWTQGAFNLIETMGFTDELAATRRKEYAYGKSLYSDRRDVLYEAFQTKNKRLFISSMLKAERQKRTQYADRKDLELVWAKETVSRSIEYYNLAIKVFAAGIARFRLSSDKFRALIEQNDLKIKAFSDAIDAERLKIEIDRNLIERYRLEVAVQVALIELYQTQMQVVKLMSQVDAINIDITRLSIEAFISSVKEIGEQAQQQKIVADVETMRVELGEAPVWIQELSARLQSVQNDLQIAKDRYNNAQSTLAIRTSNLNSLGNAIVADAAAQQLGLNADALMTAARGEQHATRELAQGEKADARVDMAGIEANARIIQALNNVLVINARVMEFLNEKSNQLHYDVEEYNAKQQVADIMKSANLINVFTEYYNTPPPA